MKPSFRSLAVLLMLFIAVLAGCKSNALDYRVLEGEFPTGVYATLYYENIEGSKTLGATIDKNGQAPFSGLIRGYSNAFPEFALAEYANELGYADWGELAAAYGQPCSYKRFEECEVVYFFNMDGDKSTALLKRGERIDIIALKGFVPTIKKDGGDLYFLGAFKDTAALAMSKLGIESLEIEEYSIPYPVFDASAASLNIIGSLIRDSVLYISNEKTDENYNLLNSVLYRYELNTGNAESRIIEGSNAFYIFPAPTGVVVLCGEIERDYYRSLVTYIFSYSLGIDTGRQVLDMAKIEFTNTKQGKCAYDNGVIYGEVTGKTTDIRYAFAFYIGNAGEGKLIYLSRLKAADKYLKFTDMTFRNTGGNDFDY